MSPAGRLPDASVATLSDDRALLLKIPKTDLGRKEQRMFEPPPVRLALGSRSRIITFDLTTR